MGLNDPLGMNVDFSGSAGHGFSGSVEDLATFAGEVLHPRLLDESTVAEMLTVQYPELNGIVPGYGMYKPCPWGLGFEIRGSKGGDGAGVPSALTVDAIDPFRDRLGIRILASSSPNRSTQVLDGVNDCVGRLCCPVQTLGP